jgi:CRP-like cAMP-binding protein
MTDPMADDPRLRDWLHQGHRGAVPDGRDPDVRAVRRFAVPEDKPARTIVFREGEAPAALYLVEEGEIELFFERRGERRIIQICRPGLTVGDLPVILGLPAYTHSAATRSEARLLRFSTDTIRDLTKVDPTICFRFLRLVSRRLERAEQRLLELSRRSALERMATFLLREADEDQSATVKVTHGDLAAALGLSRQTVSRVLRELEDLGLIALGRRQVRLVDYHRLRAISDPLGAHEAS